MQEIDDTDRRLLRHLSTDPTLSNSDLAARARISPAICLRRLEKLRRAGVIRGVRLQIDPKAMGWDVSVSLRVTLDKTIPQAFDEFIVAARKVAEVNEIQTFLGRIDVRLNILARDLDHYQQLYREKILSLPHIADIEALMLVSEVKNDGRLPL